MICPHCKTECKSIIYAGTNFTGYNINPNKREKPPLGPVKNFDADQPAVQADERQAEAVAWRTRYRSDPGMIGHYPWTYSEWKRGAERFNPAYEFEPLYASPALAAPLTVTKQEVELAVQDYCLGSPDNREAMRHALEAFIARKGSPK